MSGKRNLPPWMDKTESSGKKPSKGEENDGDGDEETSKRLNDKITKKFGNFSNIMEGVVFVLSGFVNPERSNLRSKALEMGAEYQPDWNPNCTLLICAFPNTPKFRQVQAECGTIVSKEWIAECHSQKKLIEIETYLMHAGKPWRRNEESNPTPPRRLPKQVEESSSKQMASPLPKSKASSSAQTHFSPSNVKKWATEDLNNTVSWLESQEEKPDASELRNIAAEGILTCLQDVIDSLEQKQDVRKVTEQWNFIPYVVKELLKLDDNTSMSNSNKEIYEQAKKCKRKYETEFKRLEDDKLRKNETPKRDVRGKKVNSNDTPGYDSDETVEMTEEEIELAYNNVSLKLHDL